MEKKILPFAWWQGWMCSMGRGEYEEYEYHRRSGIPPTYEDRASSLPDPFLQNSSPWCPCSFSASEGKNCYDASGQYLFYIILLKYSYLWEEIWWPFKFCDGCLDLPKPASLRGDNSSFRTWRRSHFDAFRHCRSCEVTYWDEPRRRFCKDSWRLWNKRQGIN